MPGLELGPLDLGARVLPLHHENLAVGKKTKKILHNYKEILIFFTSDKCKVVTIKHRTSPLAMFPFVAYQYHLGENLLSYAVS